MLTIQNLSFYYGSRPLYKDASLHIKPKNRIGLIGANGTGKTTLLKLINGQLTADEGSISKSKESTLGFLNQDLLSFDSGEPILTVAMSAFERELELQRQIDEILVKMETDYSDELLDRLARLQDEFTTLGGYSIQSKAEEILEGLGFSTASLQRPLREFSGGWRMRVMLAKLLLQKPALLMLDEPTNHLDLPSIIWLEEYLSNYEGAVMIVSHDREFLDRAVNMTVEVSGGKLNVYAGNYSFYLEEKALRDDIQRNAYNNQQQMIRQTESFINRFRAKASKSKQVQSRVKMLDRIDLVDEVAQDNVAMTFRFMFNQQPGKIITQLEEASKAYGDNVILKDTNITIERGDKIALIGANGKGKSTLLRIIGGNEGIDSGQRIEGYNVIAAFYAQHQLESLNVENEIFSELKQAGSEKTEQELRNILGCFLFKDEEVFKKIKVLSGGEKSRVALAKTLISEANFLLLDEPTNHLDMKSVNILIQALQQYAGSYLIVSHDRHFVAHVANKIWYIEDHVVKEYKGTYDEYEYWKETKEAELAAQKSSSQQNSSKTEKKVETPKNQTVKPNDETQKQIKQLKNKLEELEKNIAKISTDKDRLEEKLADPSVYASPEKLLDTSRLYEKASKDLEKLNQEFEQVFNNLDRLEK